ncbi:TPA: filamentous hemagglutinin N-terminal domain-containing protein [Klebsiella variicola]|uniref:hemagglutinin repeat-containing protein n=1 Tax=Klebsiella variicola TaxID=244366 RepID=UPI00101DA252|nr:hemagglutinin repeat-containing protein [Klebsiella variicola]HBX2059191.1 filamentous hemagglutinin N-terminal domain-containing protein [Klebsiella variicola]HBZ7678482.1 hemagglutinin repeat-containing protein [Klebsiella variicola subsp. variicola]
MHQPPIRLSSRLLSYVISLLLVGQPLLPAIGAAINPEGATGVDSAANGVPVVNIATPNGSGISHNQFKDYHVGQEGLILNNATGKLNQTQLGGLIQNNPNLQAGREAKGIINEVTGGHRSQLNGYTEVAGKAANVMVANPYGITCNGCGFINTPQATLTTGKPVFDEAGNLQALEVAKGTISIEGKGIDVSGSDALSIISRATEVNAAVHARDLSVIAGANRVDSHGTVTPMSGEGQPPTLAVDTGALGGMYANRIRLVSSENGVGVNLGDLNARQGDITLEANGRLALRHSLASGGIAARGQHITLTGDHKAGGAITLHSQSDLVLSKGSLTSDTDLRLTAGGSITQSSEKLTAGRDVSLTASAIRQDSDSQIDAGRQIALRAGDSVTNEGRMTATDELSVTAKTLAHHGALIAGNAISLDAARQTLNGAINATGDITVSGETIATSAASQIQGKHLHIAAKQVDLKGTQAAKSALTVRASEKLTHSGKSSADTLSLQAPQLSNSGVAIASRLTTQSQSLTNNGLLQGEAQLSVTSQTLNNQQDGTLYSAANLTLAIPDIRNRGLITSDHALALASTTLLNSGAIIADTLTVKTVTLSDDGLLQGNQALTLTGDSLAQGATGRWLTAGDMSLTATTLNAAGAIQGQQLRINAQDWRQSGSLLATGNLDATVSGALRNDGDIMSQRDFVLRTSSLTNSGKLLAAGDMSLTGALFNNNGSLQANRIALTQETIDNQGTVIGLDALTLSSNGTVDNRGDLLSQGDLTLSAGDIANHGRVQGKTIVIEGADLSNSGAIQSAVDLALTLSGDLQAINGSKMTALRDVHISGHALSNEGLVSASTLTMEGDSLSNSGEISGVSHLDVLLNGDLQQQGKLLTGGSLVLHAQDLNNSGQLQGANTQISVASLSNSGRLQGDSNLTLNLLKALNNQANGAILSQGELTLTASALSNHGTIQSHGATSLNSTLYARNAGNIVSGGDLTLSTPDYSGSGWLQATHLLLDAAKIANAGTMLAANQATLTGSTLLNSGTVQAAQLSVDTRTLANSGTLFGKQNLLLYSDSVNNDAGKLFSGGDLLANVASLSGAGQIVALGNLTLALVNSWIAQGTVAANKQLVISSQSDITNAGALQGNGVTLTAAGQLINNGQLVAGNGKTALTGQQIAMNGEGSLQAGGDVSLISLGHITLDGFTGTAGNLVLTATETILNTALLYAGHNLSLFANRIHNLHGDILAGNDLVMQKNASGDANTEVINTSGTIETTQGDMTISTGYLLNQRDGLEVKISQTSGEQAIPGLGEAIIDVDISQLADGTYGLSSYLASSESGACNGHGACSYHNWNQLYYAMYAESAQQKFIGSQTRTEVTSRGGAARLAAGKNLHISASTLENVASHILANSDIALTGNTLNNQSWQAGTVTDWYIYQYDPHRYGYNIGFGKGAGYAVAPGAPYPTDDNNYEDAQPECSTIGFTLAGHESTAEQGEIYRSVIQAGGNVSASFASDISNTNSIANADKISNTLVAPDLNTPSAQLTDDSESMQSLAGADTTAITRPDWNDTTGSGSQTIGNGTALVQEPLGDNYPLPSGINGYFVTSDDPDSPYLITVNPKLNGLGQLDPSLFGDLYKLAGMNPASAPRETGSQYTDGDSFLGSSYMLDRLGLNPDSDYRFLGDAAFDTRYVSNVVLNQTGSRYLDGLGSDLDQMRYLMDNAADVQTSLGLTFGVALTSAQVAALNRSILWWGPATLNGRTVMVPKVYLSPKDVSVRNGSVISGNTVQLAGGNISNSGSTLLARDGLAIDSSNSFSNLNAGLIRADGRLDLSASGDINNIGSTISAKTLQLVSTGGSINNVTRTEQWRVGDDSRWGNIQFSGTDSEQTAAITASDGLYMAAANTINITGATVSAGGDLVMEAGSNINIAANQFTESRSQSGFWGQKHSRSSSTTYQSSITAGGNAIMRAGNDLNVTASAINAGHTAQLVAANDLNLNAAGNEQSSRTGGSESHQSGAERSTVTAGDKVTLVAGRDVTSQAAGIAAEGNVGIQAGRDVNLRAEATTAGSSSHSGKKTVIDESVRQQGTDIASGGSTTIIAGRDVNAEAAQVTASGNIGLAAGRDVNLTTATESDYHYKEETKTKKGFLSKKTTHTIEEESATREAGTLLSGDQVQVLAENNLLLQGSAVVAEGDVQLHAGNNVEITAATNTDTAWRFKEEKKSGLTGTGGIGFSIGSSKTTHELREAGTTQSQSASTTGSTGGSMVISAGKQAHIGGSDVVAGRDIRITGDSVVIDPGHDTRTVDEKFEQKSSGLTVALSGSAGGAVNNTVSAAQKAKEVSDGRLSALQGTKAALSGIQAAQAVALDGARGGSDKDNNNTIGISASLGSQSSSSRSHSEQVTTSGSTLNAGNNLAVTATGGDITVAGGQVKAGKDVTLEAFRDVNLTVSQDTQLTTGSNKSSGGSIGVGVGVGSGGAGVSISANASSSKGHESGNGTWQNETTVDAGHQVIISSGRDTTLAGAQVSGHQVTADVGRDLTITSLRDSDHYDSTQSSLSGGLGYTFGAGSWSGSLNTSRDKMTSDYDSVQEQSGIFAGQGGFDVTVGSHTQLNGGVIAATGSADKNSLDTGTLGFSDIHNQADYRTQHQGGGISTGGSIGSQFAGNMTSALLAGGGNSGHAEGTTQSAVSEGTITIRDRENQKQDVADLSRDTEHASGSIGPIFDKEKEQRRLQEVQLTGEIGSQAADIARTQGEIAKQKAIKDPAALTAAEAKLKAEGNSSPTAEQIADQAGRTAMAAYGTGSDLQRGIQAATAALQGLAGGDIAGALAGASAPELANLIGHGSGLSDGAAVVAHAILGGAVAALQGNSAAAGAAGAAAGELAARAIAGMLYPCVTDLSTLTEAQKQMVSTLATVPAGMAGGLAGDSTASAVAGAQGGKNAVENNLLGGNEDAQAAWIRQHGIDMASCSDNPGGAACQKAINERDAVGFALATGSVALLPGGAQAMWGLGAGANAGISYLADGTIDPANAAIAGWVNVISMGNGLAGTIGWNAAGGALGNWIDDKDPLTGAITNGIGAGIGYGIGKGISWGANAGANWWKDGWDPKFNPVLQKYAEIKGDFGISKEVTPSNIPGSFGDIGASFSSEYGGKKLEPIIEEKLK